MHRLIAGVIKCIARWLYTLSFDECHSPMHRIAVLHYVCCSLHVLFRYRNLQIHVLLHCRRNGRSLGNRYGRGRGPIWLDNLHCTGTESQLASCRHNGWGRNNCGHHEDVAIRCLYVLTIPPYFSTTTSTPSATTTVPGTSTKPSDNNKLISFTHYSLTYPLS